MPDEQNQGSAQAGSPDELIQSGPSANVEGEPYQSVQQQGSEETISKEKYEEARSQYEELEKKFGAQGNELGDLRDFYRGIEPILMALEENPALTRALHSGQIDANTVEAILSGKTTVEDVTKVTEAQDQVKKEMGREAYAKAAKENPVEIEKRIQDLASQFKKDLEENNKKVFSSIEQENRRKEFQTYTDNFIAFTEDFPDYADDISKWLEDHPRVDDIAVAYDAVKGAKLSVEKKTAIERAAAEKQKEIAANAGGGASQNAHVINNREVSDELIAPSGNPNELF